MKLESLPLPDIYTDSYDFRLFVRWFAACLSKFKYDTEHIIDNYDPLKCKKELLWLLGDTIGYKYDDRMPPAVNRLILLIFMNMIKKKGSKSGVTYAAEANLAQFNIISYGAGYIDNKGKEVRGKDILYDRLEDTTVPTNAVNVTPHVREGYIDVVYFSTEKPIDICIEYVRPLGMYVFSHAGVRVDARTQISIDARLTDITDIHESIGSTHVADYTRKDYASLQKVKPSSGVEKQLNVDIAETRDSVYYRNKAHEGSTNKSINPGYRALYSLQLANNEHIVKALIDPIFSLGYGPQKDTDTYPDDVLYVNENNVIVENPKSYLKPPYKDTPPYNLRYDRDLELSISPNITTLDEENDHGTITSPKPKVNPIMTSIGDAISLGGQEYSDVDDSGKIVKKKEN